MAIHRFVTVQLLIFIFVLFDNVIVSHSRPSHRIADSNLAFPHEMRAMLGSAPCLNHSRLESLIKSADMLDRTATQLLSVPYSVFLAYFLQPNLFPTWNTDYTQVNTTEFEVCSTFHGTFTTKINVTLPSGFSFNSPMLLVVNVTETEATIGWQFNTSNPNTQEVLYYGAHFYYMGQQFINGRDATLYISWEKIFGDFVGDHSSAFEAGLAGTVLRPDWLGANCLEQVWLAQGDLVPADVQQTCNPSLSQQQFADSRH